jgi:hypothetical protein
MNNYQLQAVWELCRQGYPGSADEAESRWSAGETYHPEGQVRLSRWLHNLIDQCNYEVSIVSKDGFS